MDQSQKPPEPNVEKKERPVETKALDPNDPINWTDAQPRTPVHSPVEGFTEDEPEEGLKQGPSGAPEDGGDPPPQPDAESDLGDSASAAPPQPETNKRDPSYWKFLGYDRLYMCHVPSP